MTRETYIVTFHRVGPNEYKETSRNAVGSITDALGVLEEQYGDEWLDRHLPILVSSPEDGSIAWVSDSVGKGLAHDDTVSDATFFANPRENHAELSLFDIRSLTLDMAMRCTPPSDTMKADYQAEQLVTKAKVFEDYLLGIVNEKTATARPARQHSGGQKVNISGGGPQIPPGEYTLLPPKADDLVIPDLDPEPPRVRNRSRSAEYNDREPGEPEFS